LKIKLFNFAIAALIYGLSWFAGYHLMLKHDGFGIGAFVFWIFHILLQVAAFCITMALIFSYKKGHFSAFSFLSFFCNTAMLYFLLAYPGSIEDIATRMGYTSAAFIFFLVHLYAVFRKPKLAK
jgi:hypothetical protein